MKFFLSSVLSFLLLLAAASAAAQPSEQILRQALDLLSAGKTAEVIELMSQFKQDQPLDARGRYITGLALAQMARFGEAAAEFDEAIQLDPETLEYRVKAALAQKTLGRSGEALERLSVINGQNLARAEDVEALWLLGDLYFEQNRGPDVERVLNRLLEVQPSDPRAQLRLGQIDLIEGRFESALERFQSARGRMPDAGPVHHATGLAHWRLDQTDAALESLRKAVSLGPDNATFHLDLGRLLLEMERPQEAIQHLEKVQAMAPDNQDASFQLVRAQRALGNLEGAKAETARLQALQGDSAREQGVARRSNSKIATVAELLPAGKVNEAFQLLLEIIDEDPDLFVAHNYLAKIYISSGLWEKANQHLAEMQRLDPESFDVPFLTASMYYRRREVSRALEPGLNAKKLRPDYADLRNLLGNIYFALGQRAEARQEYEAAVKLDPDRLEFQLNLKSVSN